MSLDIRDKLRDHERELSDIRRQLQYIPSRPAALVDPSFQTDTAAEIIAPGDLGALAGGGTARNGTGRPIWNGATVWLDPSRGTILASNSAGLIWATWDGSGLKIEVESYDIADDSSAGVGGVVAQHEFYDDTGVTNANVTIDDPAGVLADVTTADPMVCFAAKGDAGAVVLTPISPQAGAGGGGGGDPWTGWPGPDPTTGVAPCIIFKASCNEAGHVTSADATFSVDGAVAMVGTAPADPGGATVTNIFGCAILNNQEVLVVGNSEGDFWGWPIQPTIAIANVNETDGVSFSETPFELDGFGSLLNTIPGSYTAEADNTQNGQYANNQPILVLLKASGKWAPLLHYDKAEAVVTSASISARSESPPDYTWGTGTVTLLKRTDAGTRTETGGIASVTVYNSTNNVASEGDIIQLKMINGDWMWDVGDC